MGDYANQVCERCGSKKRITTMRKEVLQTYTGTSDLEISEIVCTNEECQAAFEIKMEEDAKKRMKLKEEKEKSEIIRKENILAKLKEKRKAAA